MDTRNVEREIFIRATPAEVWRALTDADEIMRWFAVGAQVDPGVAGSIWVSWGEGAEARAPITVWEPERHLQWAEQYGPVRLAVDYQLEPAEGGTIVRLVHSGFGTGAEWDEQYHMTEGGWTYFLQHLRHYLERHGGTPRVLVREREQTSLPRDVAYARLLGEHGLAARGRLRGLQPGERYRVRTATGDALEGTVLFVQEPYQIALTVDNLNDAVLFLEIEPAGEGAVRPGLWLSTYDLPADDVAAIRQRVSALYHDALA